MEGEHSPESGVVNLEDWKRKKESERVVRVTPSILQAFQAYKQSDLPSPANDNGAYPAAWDIELEKRHESLLKFIGDTSIDVSGLRALIKQYLKVVDNIISKLPQGAHKLDDVRAKVACILEALNREFPAGLSKSTE